MGGPLAARIEAANAALIVDGNTDAIGVYFAGDYVAHLVDRDLDGGHDGIRRFVNALRRSFTDLTVDVEVLVESEDRVAWYRTVSGTHEADFMGFPATGRRIVWRDMLTSRFDGGLIAEEWAVSDLAERLLRAKKG